MRHRGYLAASVGRILRLVLIVLGGILYPTKGGRCFEVELAVNQGINKRRSS